MDETDVMERPCAVARGKDINISVTFIRGGPPGRVGSEEAN